VSDLSYADAEEQAFRRRAEAIGADYGIDIAARSVLSDQLGFLRNNPASTDDLPLLDGELHMMVGWDCDDEAAIVLGRLRERGWVLVRATDGTQHGTQTTVSDHDEAAR